MNKLAFDIGGRPITNDDLEVLQNLSLLLGGALLTGIPTCVISGCRVTPAGAAGRYNVAAGLVWMNGVYQFDGASNVELPGEFVLGPVEIVDERLYETGGTKACITNQKAFLDVPDDVGPYTMEVGGPLMWYERVAALQRPIGLLEHGVFSLSDYDNTGLGKGRHRGWALANGENGTTNMAQLFPVGYDASSTEYSVSRTGGAPQITLSVAQLPPHTHGTNARENTGNVTRDTGGSSTANSGGPARIDSAGGGQPIDIRPPFKVVAYRQWIGL